MTAAIRSTGQASQLPAGPSGLTSVLYELGFRVLNFLSGLSWFQNLTKRQRGRMALLQLFLKEMNFPEASWNDITRRSVSTDLAGRLWGGRFLRLAPVTVEGLENIATARKAGRGIILVRSHQKLGRGRTSSPLSFWLANQEFRPEYTMGRAPRHSALRMNVPKQLSGAQDLWIARDLLQKGRVVEIVPDGQRGTSAISIRFFDRDRELRTGFAELAVAARASVIPLFLEFGLDGAIKIRVLPALHVPDGAPHEQQIASLINQYAEILSNFWLANPHLIAGRYLKRHLASPKKPGAG